MKDTLVCCYEKCIRNKSGEYTYFCLLDALIDHYLFALEEMKNVIEKQNSKFNIKINLTN